MNSMTSPAGTMMGRLGLWVLTRMIFGILLAVAVIIMIAGATFAQGVTGGTSVDMGPLASLAIEYLAPVALTLLTGLAAWAFKLFRQKTGWQIDGQVGMIVDIGLQKGVDFAAAQLKDRAAGGIPIAFKNSAIAIAANYAIEKLPGALRHFGITDSTDARLAEMIEARLEDWLVDPGSERMGAGARSMRTRAAG